MKGGWPLVGRAEEIAVVAKAMALAGGASGVVLAGAAGVGKTRLAREALALAQQRKRPCRWIVATASARSIPLGAFAQYASAMGPDPLRRIQDVIQALTKPGPPMTSVVGIDDAHLLDEQSALLVQQLVRQRCATVVLTVRSGEQAPHAIASLWKDSTLPRLELQPLSSAEMAGLLTKVLGGPVESSSAERLWRYTHGNVLYLRQLLADELAAGRISKRSDIWIWDGHADMSPTLIELIEWNIGRRDESVVNVLDILSIVEPVESRVLQRLSSAGAISTAEDHGLITVDHSSEVVRLGHPLFGEARRSRLGTMRRRALCGRLVQAIGEMCEPSLQNSVRRAVLMLESDRKPNPALLLEAATAALQLLDMKLAIRLARSATDNGGGVPAQLTYAAALTMNGKPGEAMQVLCNVEASARDTSERAQIALWRAANLAWSLARPRAALVVLDGARDAASACGFADSFDAVSASCQAALGRPRLAIALAIRAVGSAAIDGLAAMLGRYGLVTGLGDTGELAELSSVASAGYELARTDSQASHLRFVLGMLQIDGLYFAGALKEASAVAAELRRLARDGEVSLAMTALLMGQAEIALGKLGSAQQWFREALAMQMSSPEDAASLRELGGLRLATSLGMGGHRDAAQQVFDDTPPYFPDEYLLWEPLRALALAWVSAASGVSSEAAVLAMHAADAMRAQERPAREVLCLQTATQFGETTTAERLAQLATTVQGPRVAAAAQHALALRKRDGAALLSASSSYEGFGDRVAAADTAAQAAIVFQRQGARGSSLTAAEVAKRLADASGAGTPAIRALTTSMLTDRQREIVSLAAAGLSNRDIAVQLAMSVRSVEGHILRGCRRTGLNTREDLIALVQVRGGDTVEKS